MKKQIALSIILAASFVLSACGGNSAPSDTINVTFTEFHFEPDNFTVPAGQEITINATNNGAVVHEFIIMKYGTTVGDDFDSADAGNIYWEIQTEPGESATATFTAPSEPGEYQVVCGTKGHFIAGMVAKMTVVAP